MATTSVCTLAIVQTKSDPDWRWLGWKTLVCFAIGAALLAWFLVRCSRSANPLLRLDLFRAPDLRYGALGMTIPLRGSQLREALGMAVLADESCEATRYPVSVQELLGCWTQPVRPGAARR